MSDAGEALFTTKVYMQFPGIPVPRTIYRFHIQI